MRHPYILPVAAAAAILAGACGGDRQSFVANAGTDTPTMTTHDVSTFISDSGYTRYHIVTPEWQMYDDSHDPYWRFPYGLDMEQYDQAMHPCADISCDSAIYFSRRRLWRLDGNVVMVNTLRDSFLTQQLFWDQQRRLVYSDSFIHIVKEDRTIEGYGFESNQDMTTYSVNRPTGIFPAQRPQALADTAADTAPAMADTLAPAIPAKTPVRRLSPMRASDRHRQDAPY